MIYPYGIIPPYKIGWTSDKVDYSATTNAIEKAFTFDFSEAVCKLLDGERVRCVDWLPGWNLTWEERPFGDGIYIESPSGKIDFWRPEYWMPLDKWRFEVIE